MAGISAILPEPSDSDYDNEADEQDHDDYDRNDEQDYDETLCGEGIETQYDESGTCGEEGENGMYYCYEEYSHEDYSPEDYYDEEGDRDGGKYVYCESIKKEEDEYEQPDADGTTVGKGKEPDAKEPEDDQN